MISGSQTYPPSAPSSPSSLCELRYLINSHLVDLQPLLFLVSPYPTPGSHLKIRPHHSPAWLSSGGFHFVHFPLPSLMFTPLWPPVFSSLDSGSLPASGPLSLSPRSSCQSDLSLKGIPCSERTNRPVLPTLIFCIALIWSLFWWCGLPALLDISSVRSEAAVWLFF